MAAGLTVWNFYFRPYQMKQELVASGPEYKPAGRLVQDYIASLQGWIHIEYHSPYSTKLLKLTVMFSSDLEATRHGRQYRFGRHPGRRNCNIVRAALDDCMLYLLT